MLLITLIGHLKSLLIFVQIGRSKGSNSALRPSLEKMWRSSSSSGGDDAVVNKGGRCASRGFNLGVGAYFTVCGPISRRQSEPARIHHRVTPRNNFLLHNELLSKPSYLFISPRLLLLSFFRPLCPTIQYYPSRTNRVDPHCYLLQLGSLLHFSKPKRCLLCRNADIHFSPQKKSSENHSTAE